MCSGFLDLTGFRQRIGVDLMETSEMRHNTGVVNLIKATAAVLETPRGHDTRKDNFLMQNHSTRTPSFPENLDDYAPWVAEHGLVAPYGECQCRCGEKTNIARCTDAKKGWRKGHPLQFIHRHQCRKYQSLEEAFWANVKVGASDECWEWQSKSIAAGYGLIWACGEHITAHRFSYEIHNGPIPDGLDVLHGCDNKLCANPRHLRVGTARDNIRDAIDRGRVWDESGAHVGAKLSAADIPIIRQLASEGWEYRAIAERFNVDPANIGQIVRGQTWKHI